MAATATARVEIAAQWDEGQCYRRLQQAEEEETKRQTPGSDVATRQLNMVIGPSQLGDFERERQVLARISMLPWCECGVLERGTEFAEVSIEQRDGDIPMLSDSGRYQGEDEFGETESEFGTVVVMFCFLYCVAFTRRRRGHVLRHGQCKPVCHRQHSPRECPKSTNSSSEKLKESTTTQEAVRNSHVIEPLLILRAVKHACTKMLGHLWNLDFNDLLTQALRMLPTPNQTNLHDFFQIERRWHSNKTCDKVLVDSRTETCTICPQFLSEKLPRGARTLHLNGFF